MLNVLYVQHLVNEHDAAWGKAQKEEKKLLKLLRIPSSEVAKIVDRSIETAENDGWQPEHALSTNGEEVTSETTVQTCT